ncbi:hypothetical protein NDU88_003550 [Pleurodeles waltl]|uniref:Uncharacterized protein n=1 Tax=Pleurodeles waltl TaxID=8319 RepID=A0AAV7V127_PLEWA|nr:hypothetical protein NDU88_003550 [Pleurodeles waltl]
MTGAGRGCCRYLIYLCFPSAERRSGRLTLVVCAWRAGSFFLCDPKCRVAQRSARSFGKRSKRLTWCALMMTLSSGACGSAFLWQARGLLGLWAAPLPVGSSHRQRLAPALRWPVSVCLGISVADGGAQSGEFASLGKRRSVLLPRSLSADRNWTLRLFLLTWTGHTGIVGTFVAKM